jgi:hypothetical protein
MQEIKRELKCTKTFMDISSQLKHFELEDDPWVKFDSEILKFSDLRYSEDTMNIFHNVEYRRY